MITHVHGQELVGDESDGHAEAWFLPGNCTNLAKGYATVGCGGGGWGRFGPAASASAAEADNVAAHSETAGGLLVRHLQVQVREAQPRL
jgi:hypothetical protein